MGTCFKNEKRSRNGGIQLVRYELITVAAKLKALAHTLSEVVAQARRHIQELNNVTAKEFEFDFWKLECT